MRFWTTTVHPVASRSGAIMHRGPQMPTFCNWLKVMGRNSPRSIPASPARFSFPLRLQEAENRRRRGWPHPPAGWSSSLLCARAKANAILRQKTGEHMGIAEMVNAGPGDATRTVRAYLKEISSNGEMAEWLKAHAWKACAGETLPRVRIPLSGSLHARAGLRLALRLARPRPSRRHRLARPALATGCRAVPGAGGPGSRRARECDPARCACARPTWARVVRASS